MHLGKNITPECFLSRSVSDPKLVLKTKPSAEIKGYCKGCVITREILDTNYCQIQD